MSFSQAEQVDVPLAGEVPKIIEIARLVPCPVAEGDHLFRRDLGERVDPDKRPVWQIFVLGISPYDRDLLDRAYDLLVDGDVNLEWVACSRGKWALVLQIERMAVRVRISILTREAPFDPGGFSNSREDGLKLAADGLERHFASKREVQVLREPILAEVAPLERGTALEREMIAQRCPREPNEKPGKAVVPLEHGFREPAAAGGGEPVGEE